MDEKLKINSYYETRTNQLTKSCNDVDDDFNNIRYYYDMLSGLSTSDKVLKSRNVRIYRKVPKTGTNYFIVAFPYFDETRIQVATSYKQANASWAERFFMGWRSGQKALGDLVNQSSEIIRTIVDTLGLKNVNIDELQSSLLKTVGDGSTVQTEGRSQYLKSFENTSINLSEGLSSKTTMLLSSDSLQKMLENRVKPNYDAHKNDKYMQHYEGFKKCLENHQPVRAYLFFLLDHLCGKVIINKDSKTVSQVGQFGYDSLSSDDKNIDDTTWDLDDKVMYAVCGDAYVVKNLICTNFSIQPSNLLTPNGDYFSATISATFEPARVNTSDDVTKWLTYRPVIGGTSETEGYFKQQEAY